MNKSADLQVAGTYLDPQLPGPYSGRLSRTLGFVPGFLRGFVIEAGGMVSLLAEIVWSAVRYPTGYWGAVFEDLAQTIKKSWFPISAAVFGFCMFMSFLTVQFFAMVGAVTLFGPTIFMYSMRNFTMWVLSMVVAGVVGASLTADIGSRKVREELDAMQVMGINPVRDLGVPRVISIALFTTMLSIPANIVTLLAFQFGEIYVAHAGSSDFYRNVFDGVSTIDLFSVVVNSFLVGLLIGTVCCYKGFTAVGGANGLGKAVNQAVVISFVAVFVLLLGYQAVLLGLFPDLGVLK